MPAYFMIKKNHSYLFGFGGAVKLWNHKGWLTDQINQLITTVYVEHALSLPGSANNILFSYISCETNIINTNVYCFAGIGILYLNVLMKTNLVNKDFFYNYLYAKNVTWNFLFRLRRIFQTDSFLVRGSAKFLWRQFWSYGYLQLRLWTRKEICLTRRCWDIIILPWLEDFSGTGAATSISSI